MTKNMNKSTFRKVLCILIMMLGSSTLWAQDIPRDMSNYRDQVGSSFLFYITGDDSESCWGGKDNIYSDDSPLSVAAIHAGILKVKETKLVKVKVLEPQSSYPSITRNGITSEQSDGSDGSYQLSVPAPDEIADAPTTMSEFIGKYGVTFIFRVTTHKDGPIWGGKDNIYTTDSEIATAAIHAGLLNANQTGIVRIKILPGQSSYPELTRNGLTSHGFGEWEGSYQFVKEEP